MRIRGRSRGEKEDSIGRAAHQLQLHVLLADGDHLPADLVLALAVLPGSQGPGQGQ